MPFTFSHAAAAMPFRRTRLVLSALVVGTIAPDLEYFVRLAPGGGWGHSLAGAVCLSLPLGLVTLWLFHGFAKVPVAELLPACLERRLGPYLGPFRFRGRFRLIVFSMLIGIATHLAWDSFTHAHTWFFRHWALMHEHIQLPLVGSIRFFFFLQLLSSVGGMLVLLAWVVDWYRNTPPGDQPLSITFTAGQKAAIVATMLILAGAGAVLRGMHHFTHHWDRPEVDNIAGRFAVAFGALLWWQLVVWGLFLRRRALRPAQPSEPVVR